LYFKIFSKQDIIDFTELMERLKGIINICFDREAFIREITEQEEYFSKTLKNIVMDLLPYIDYITRIIKSWIDK
jgi:hypothetical protein